MSNLGYLRHVVDAPAYRRTASVAALRSRLAGMYGVPVESVFLTSTGRAAGTLFLRAIGGGDGAEVAVQAFTCVAAALPVVWTGSRPAWIDVDPATLSMAVDHLAARLRESTRAVIVQHSFGLPAPVQAVIDLTRPRRIPVLEDCAHALGVRSGGRMLGTAGDAAMLSFGVEKTLRTRYGGALIVNNPALLAAVQAEYARWPEVDSPTIVRWLLQPLITRALAELPARAQVAGRRVLRRAGVLAEELTAAEMHGGAPPRPPSKLPGVFCALILDELSGLEGNLSHRQRISQVYGEILHGGPGVWTPEGAAPLLRYPVICADPGQRDAVVDVVNRHGVSPSRWYEPAVFPRRVDAGSVAYDPSECPKAESLSRRVINLPTGTHVSTTWARALATDIVGVL